MTNHIHLVLTAPTAAELGGMMQDMGRRYVQYVNRSYQRRGNWGQIPIKSYTLNAKPIAMSLVSKTQAHANPGNLLRLLWNFAAAGGTAATSSPHHKPAPSRQCCSLASMIFAASA